MRTKCPHVSVVIDDGHLLKKDDESSGWMRLEL